MGCQKMRCFRLGMSVAQGLLMESTMQRTRVRRTSARQGMTLIEIMIVVVIMAMIAAAAGIGVMNAKKGVDIDTARTGVRSLASAAEAYMLQHRGACPSMAELEESKLLRRGSSIEDPWGIEYLLGCEDEGVAVRSAGPDREMNTDDDITL